MSAQTPHTNCKARWWICLTAEAWLKMGHVTERIAKHSSKSPPEGLKKKRFKMLQWRNQSPDFI